jgi:hypothetical protein
VPPDRHDALHAQRGHGNEPGAQGFDLSQFREIGVEVNADILEQVGGIFGRKPVLHRNGIDQALSTERLTASTSV